jgi:hypothetical protein
MLVFKINDYITLHLENGKTEIYIEEEKFLQCKYLLINIPIEKYEYLDKEISIDSAENSFSHILEIPTKSSPEISPEVEFWAHCSNLQVWAENNYNTKLLHRNIAFPLLKKLTEVGDRDAKRVLKEEIALRVEEGNLNVILYLLEEKFFSLLNKEERELFFLHENLPLRNKIVTALESKDGSRKKALLVIKNLADIGDITAEELTNIELENSARIQRLTIDELLFERGFDEYLSRKNLLYRILKKSEAEAIMELDDLLYNRFIELKSSSVPMLTEEFRKKELTLLPNYFQYDYGNEPIENFTFTTKDEKVIELRISGNDVFWLFKFPEPVLKLTSLQTLVISFHRIMVLPEKILILSLLKGLDISFNLIQSLPASIGMLTSLKRLNLESNNLELLPEELGCLINLEKLLVGNNNLKTLPKSMSKLKKLKHVSLYGNIFENLPEWIDNLDSL